MRERLRGERGISIIEVVIVAVLLAVVLVPIMTAFTSSQRREQNVSTLARAVDDARLALDRISREVRTADDVIPTGSDTVLAWFDRDADGYQDADEYISYDLTSGGGVDSLVRTDYRTMTPESLVEGLDLASSSFGVVAARGGDLLSIRLVVDADPGSPPGPTVLETEVLARNA